MLAAKDITNREFKILLSKQNTETATQKDKYIIEKHMIKLDFGIDKLDAKFLETFYGKTYVLYNLISLIDDKNIKSYEPYNKAEGIDYDIEKTLQKNKMIREIVSMLGFESVFDNKQIDREPFDINFKKVLEEALFFKNFKDNTLPLFELDKEVVITSRRAFLLLMNKILGDCGLGIKTKQFSKKFNKKVFTVTVGEN